MSAAGFQDLVAALLLVIEVLKLDGVHRGQRVNEGQSVLPAHDGTDLHLTVVAGGVERRVLHVERAEYVVNARQSVQCGLSGDPADTGGFVHDQIAFF